MSDSSGFSEYKKFCERELFENWKNALSKESIGEFNSFQQVKKKFKGLKVDFLPEPYLLFSINKKKKISEDDLTTENTLYVLTTNPGGVHAWQSVCNPLLQQEKNYFNLAKQNAEKYTSDIYPTANTRIENFQKFAENFNNHYSTSFKYIVQVEVCPFHSSRFPDKRKYVEHIEKAEEKEGVLIEYSRKLKELLVNKNVLVIQAAKFQNKKPKDSKWLNYLMELSGFQQPNNHLHTKFKNKNNTQVTYCHNNGIYKILSLRHGHNDLPSIRFNEDLINVS